MSLLDQLNLCRSSLQKCTTVVTTQTGHKYEEKTMEDGTVSVHPLPSSSQGYVVDTKPDLKVAEVLPHLYLGSQDVVHDPEIMKEYSICYVLSLGIKPVLIEEGIEYEYIELLDTPETDLLDCLEECFTFIDKGISKKQNVFVHCNAGVSRSPSVLIAYLMQKKNLSYEEAFHLVKSKRNCIYPNGGFVQQLKVYEKNTKTK